MSGIDKAHIRIARPTDHLPEVVSFYRDGLGFEVVGSFEDHDGFDGVMLGRRGLQYHLEFTRRKGHKSGRAPTEDNLLVIYLPDSQDWQQAVAAWRRTSTARSSPATLTGTRWEKLSRTPTATASSYSKPRGGSHKKHGGGRPSNDVALTWNLRAEHAYEIWVGRPI